MQSELTRLGYLSISSVNGSTIGMLVNRYPYLSDYARSVQVNALRDDLRAIRMSSQYADTVTAYLFPIERTLNDYLGYEMLDEEQRRLAVQLSDTRGLMSCQNQTPYIVSALRDSNFYPIYLVAVRDVYKRQIMTRLMERSRSEANPQMEGITTPIRLMTAMIWPVATLSSPRLWRNST